MSVVLKAAEILGVDEVIFVEPQFAMLPDPRYNVTLALSGGDEGRLLLDEKEDPIALAFRNGDCWVTGSFLCRNPSATLIDKFEAMNGEIYQEEPGFMGLSSPRILQHCNPHRSPPVDRRPEPEAPGDPRESHRGILGIGQRRGLRGLLLRVRRGIARAPGPELYPALVR